MMESEVNFIKMEITTNIFLEMEKNTHQCLVTSMFLELFFSISIYFFINEFCNQVFFRTC